jgi:hypothetical protein
VQGVLHAHTCNACIAVAVNRKSVLKSCIVSTQFSAQFLQHCCDFWAAMCFYYERGDEQLLNALCFVKNGQETAKLWGLLHLSN